MTNELSTRTADLGWMGGVIGLTDTELIYGDQYEDYDQWWNLCKTKLFTVDFVNNLQFLYPSDYYWKSAEGIVSKGNGFSWDAFGQETEGDILYTATEFWSGSWCGYAYFLYDQTTGCKLLDVTDDIQDDPHRAVRVEEVVEFALRYANAQLPMPAPAWVTPKNVGTYDKGIITEELMNKQINLPAASCAELPSEWHGIVVEDMERNGSNGATDYKVYEYEIEIIKKAGFNFIGLNLDFSYLQSYEYEDLVYYAFPENGNLDENKLKELDQILAWCMERDIHLNIRASGFGGFSNDLEAANGWKKDGVKENFAAVWQALAQRYADIPNEYLSFTLDSGNYSVGSTEYLMPTVEAIRAETPERCIIAEVYRRDISAQAFAEMGVALSYGFRADHSDLFDCWGDAANKESGVTGFSWPYNGTLDAHALLDGKLWQNGPSANEVMAVAQEYGVGFMLSDFGIRMDLSGFTVPLSTRFADEEYHAMIEDIISTTESLGYGWCFAGSYGSYGLMFGYPIIENTTYEQIGNYPCYVDQTILGWFKEINGVQ